MKVLTGGLLLLLALSTICFGESVGPTRLSYHNLSRDVQLDSAIPTTPGGFEIGPNVWSTGFNDGGISIDQGIGFDHIEVGIVSLNPDAGTPEPGTWILMGTGLLMLGRRALRR